MTARENLIVAIILGAVGLIGGYANGWLILLTVPALVFLWRYAEERNEQ